MYVIVADEIKRLSQEEGLNDREIAEKLKCCRGTVLKIRQANGIPRANLLNRKDKLCVCKLCNKKFYIKRKDKKPKYCNECNNFRIEKIKKDYEKINISID